MTAEELKEFRNEIQSAIIGIQVTVDLNFTKLGIKDWDALCNMDAAQRKEFIEILHPLSEVASYLWLSLDSMFRELCKAQSTVEYLSRMNQVYKTNLVPDDAVDMTKNMSEAQIQELIKKLKERANT